MISGFIIIVSIKKIYDKPLKIPTNIFTIVIGNFILLIKNAFFSLKELIAIKIPNSYTKLYNICTKFYKRFSNYEKAFCFVFILMPYLIVLMFFIIDVFVNFRLNYFYKSIPLLTLPLFFHIFLYFMEDLAKNLEAIEDDLIVDHYYLPNGKDFFSFSKKPDKIISNESFSFAVEEYLKLIKFRGYLISYYNVENYYKIRLFLLIHICYLIGWFYVIYINILFLIQ